MTKHRLIFLFGCGFYLLAIQLVYIITIVPDWGYTGMVFADPPLWICLVVNFAAIVPAFRIRVVLVRPSQWLVLYLYLAVYVPACIVPLFRNTALGIEPRSVLPLVATLLICMLILVQASRYARLALPRIVIRRDWFWIGVVCVLTVAFGTLCVKYGSSMRMVSPNNVAEQRLASRETLDAFSSSGRLIGYTISYFSYVANPLLVAVGIWYRKPVVVGLGIMGQLVSYSINAARGPIVAVLVVLCLYYSVRQKRFSFGNFWAFGFGLIALLGIAVHFSSSPSVENLISWMIMRTFITPGYLTGIYHEFFSTNPQTYFSHVSGLGWLGHNQYESAPLGFIIGDYLGFPGNNANANLWADGFASLGYIGMVIVTVFAAGVFYLLDCVAMRMKVGFATLIIGAHALSLADTPFFTEFLGGGLAMSILIIYLYPDPPPPG